MDPDVTELSPADSAYRELIDHLGDCPACHIEHRECSEGDRLRKLVRETRA